MTTSSWQASQNSSKERSSILPSKNVAANFRADKRLKPNKLSSNIYIFIRKDKSFALPVAYLDQDSVIWLADCLLACFKCEQRRWLGEVLADQIRFSGVGLPWWTVESWLCCRRMIKREVGAEDIEWSNYQQISGRASVCCCVSKGSSSALAQFVKHSRNTGADKKTLFLKNLQKFEKTIQMTQSTALNIT